MKQTSGDESPARKNASPVKKVICGAVLALLCPLLTAQTTNKIHENTSMLVSTAWLAGHLGDPEVVTLCIAASSDFCAHHIPGVRRINFNAIVVERDGIPNELPPISALRATFQEAAVGNTSRIILYGERYGLLAARAWFTLDYLGLGDRAALLNGGIEKWRAEGRPQSMEWPKTSPAANLTVHPNPKTLIETGELRDIVSSSSTNARLLDARPAEEYSGERLSEDVHKAGHIPGATSLYWMRNIVSAENPVLRPVEELRALYGRAPADSRVITYCRTGMQSSYDYFVAKYLGYDASMYDGSYYQWSELEHLPVVKGDIPRDIR